MNLTKCISFERCLQINSSMGLIFHLFFPLFALLAFNFFGLSEILSERVKHPRLFFWGKTLVFYIFRVNKFELCISIGNIQTIHQAITLKGVATKIKRQTNPSSFRTVLQLICSCFTGSKPAASAGSWPQDHPKRASFVPEKTIDTRGQAAFDAPWRKQFRIPDEERWRKKMERKEKAEILQWNMREID